MSNVAQEHDKAHPQTQLNSNQLNDEQIELRKSSVEKSSKLPKIQNKHKTHQARLEKWKYSRAGKAIRKSDWIKQNESSKIGILEKESTSTVFPKVTLADAMKKWPNSVLKRAYRNPQDNKIIAETKNES